MISLERKHGLQNGQLKLLDPSRTKYAVREIYTVFLLDRQVPLNLRFDTDDMFSSTNMTEASVVTEI